MCVSVPTGNFGDALSGYYAKRLGIPIQHILIATNANDLLPRLLATGSYAPAQVVKPTLAPAMDIQISSNVERLLFHLAAGDAPQIRTWMEALRNPNQRSFQLPDTMHQSLKATFSSIAVARHEVMYAQHQLTLS